MFADCTRVAGASLLLVCSAAAQVVPFIGQQEAKLTAPDAASGDAFGTSVALAGDTAIIGAGQDDATGTAYVYVRSGTTWSQQAKLTAVDAQADDRFGYAVAASADTVVIGAWGSDANAGSAYVFVRSGTTWTQQAELNASDAMPGDHFGYSVAVSGDTAVVGAAYEPSAYVFTRSGTSWSQQAKLTASDLGAAGFFGWAVAISADTIVVGTRQGDAGSVAAAGTAYVFVRTGTTWSQQAKLMASDAAVFDAFGSSVAVSDDTVLVGSMFNDHDGLIAAGSAYVFVRSGENWIEQAKLTGSSAGEYDYFGTSVDLVGDNAVIGAVLHEAGGTYDAGSAFVFIRTGTSWSEQATLAAPDAAPSDDLGIAVAIEGDTVLAGANEGDAGTVPDAGSAYVFQLVTIGTWSDLGLALTGTQGLPALTSMGYMLAGLPVSLSLAQAKPFALSPLVVGVGLLAAPFKGGVMVPVPDFIFPLFTDFFGKSSFGGLWPAGVPSGFTTYFQWWVQDPAGPKGFAASNALAGTTP